MEMPYNFISIPDKVFNLWTRGMNYTVDKINVLNFILFCLLIVVGFPLCMIITTPILLLAGIEHLLFSTIDYLSEGIDNNKGKVKGYLAATASIIMMPPVLTFFGPALIWDKVKKYRVKKREERTRLTLEQINNDIRHWCAPPHFNIKRVEDFKPKHKLKAHTFIEKRKERFISPGVYIEGNMYTASGYNSIAIGYENTYTQQPNRIRYE